MGDLRVCAPAGRPARGYLPALDGLRAIAVALVVVHHAVPFPFGGQIGVDIFFVLSGYLITGLLLKEIRRTGRLRLRTFYIRRAIRLYPPLLTALVVLFVPGVLLAPSVHRFLAENVMAATYTTPFGLLISESGSRPWRHTWSLGMEELFYLVWPVLLIVLLRIRARVDVAAALLGTAIMTTGLVFSLASPGSIGVGADYFFRSGGLFLGCALAVLLDRHPDIVVPTLAGWTGLLLVAVSVAAPEHVSPILAAVGTALWVAQLTRGRVGALTRVLEVRPMAYLGRISYEIYLWHYALLIIGAWAFNGLTPFVAWSMVALSVALSAMTHRLWAPAIDRLKARWAPTASSDVAGPRGGLGRPALDTAV